LAVLENDDPLGAALDIQVAQPDVAAAMTNPDGRVGHCVRLDVKPIHGNALRRQNIQDTVEHIARSRARLQQRRTGQTLQDEVFEADDLNIFGASSVHRDNGGHLLV
jgi:hypothetical protein